MLELTEREQQVLSYLQTVMADGPPPSIREICAYLKVNSTSTIHRILTSLEDKGYIERRDNLNRCIKLRQFSCVHVPLVGTVTAGQPILAVQFIEKYLPFPTPSQSGEFFALHVKGDSMIQAGILDGDLVIIRRCETASNGEIVVALLDDEATVKRFYKENGHYRLQPENDLLEPIYCEHVSILGIVVGLQRLY